MAIGALNSEHMQILWCTGLMIVHFKAVSELQKCVSWLGLGYMH